MPIIQMRNLWLIAVSYCIILLTLLVFLNFDLGEKENIANLVNRGNILLSNIVYIIKLHISEIKLPAFSNIKIENEEPLHPLKEVIKRSGGRVILIPNSSQIFDGSWVKLKPTNVTINSAGLRDYEYTYKKPNGVCRAAVLGDSYTFGWGVEFNETFSKVLERDLNENKNGRYQILNFGVPGYGFKEEMMQLHEDVTKFNPDIVILASNSDDLRNHSRFNKIMDDLASDAVFYENFPQYIGKKVTNFTKLRLSRTKVYPLIKEEEYQQFYNTTKGKELIEAYSSIAYNESKNREFRVVILALSMEKEQFNILKTVAKNHKWSFIDFSYLHHKTRFDMTKIMIAPPYDGHPTPYAHQLIADKLYNEVNWAELCSKAFNASLSAS